jgi:hypothetical protein
VITLGLRPPLLQLLAFLRLLNEMKKLMMATDNRGVDQEAITLCYTQPLHLNSALQSFNCYRAIPLRCTAVVVALEGLDSTMAHEHWALTVMLEWVDAAKVQQKQQLRQARGRWSEVKRHRRPDQNQSHPGDERRCDDG